jgi:hypothetical protein
MQRLSPRGISDRLRMKLFFSDFLQEKNNEKAISGV